MSSVDLDEARIRSRGLVWATVARFATVALFFESLAPILPQMAASHAITVNDFQLLLGISYVVFASCQLFSVSVIHRLGLFRTISLSSIVLGVAAVSVCVSDSSAIFMASLLSMFIINSVGSNATRVALREVTSDAGFKRLFALATGVIEIKQMFLPVMIGIVAAAYGWRLPLLLMVIPVVVAGVWIEMVPRSKSVRPCPDTAWPNAWFEIFCTRRFLLPVLVAASFYIVFSPISARLPFLLSDDVNLSPALTGLYLSVSSAATASGLFLSSRLIASWSSQKILWLGWAMMCIGLVCMLLQQFFGVACIVAGVIFVQSALGFIVVPCTGDALSSFSSAHREKASGLFGFVNATVSGLSVACAGALNISNAAAATVLTASSLILIAMLLTAKPQKKA